jgi:hypothetical protein
MPRPSRHIPHQRAATPIAGPLLVKRLLAHPMTRAIVARVRHPTVGTQIAVFVGHLVTSVRADSPASLRRVGGGKTGHPPATVHAARVRPEARLIRHDGGPSDGKVTTRAGCRASACSFGLACLNRKCKYGAPPLPTSEALERGRLLGAAISRWLAGAKHRPSCHQRRGPRPTAVGRQASVIVRYDPFRLRIYYHDVASGGRAHAQGSPRRCKP